MVRDLLCWIVLGDDDVGARLDARKAYEPWERVFDLLVALAAIIPPHCELNLTPQV